MAQTLDPILPDTTITYEGGKITQFFRLRWARLITLIGLAPTVANATQSGLTAALATTTLFVTRTAGLYRVTLYIRKTVADGVSSRVTPTIAWTETGVALQAQEADFTTDTITATDRITETIQVDANVPITLAATYASNTAARMTWGYVAAVEQLAT